VALCTVLSCVDLVAGNTIIQIQCEPGSYMSAKTVRGLWHDKHCRMRLKNQVMSKPRCRRNPA